MADGVVQVAPDSSGKKVDTSELTRADGITVVERQRIAIGDPNAIGNLAIVDIVGALSVRLDISEQLFREMVRELRKIRHAMEDLSDQAMDDRDIDADF